MIDFKKLTHQKKKHILIVDHNAILDSLDALRSVLSHFKPNNRWPCQECGRTSNETPLRTILRETEDGKRYHDGCHSCNADAVLSAVEKTRDNLLSAISNSDLIQTEE